jgi:hypothetical protein
LFDYRIIVNNVAKAVAGYCRIGNGDYGSREDEAGDLFGFSSDPMEAIRSGFSCGVGEGFAVPIQIESESWFGFVVIVGRVERVCVWVGRGGGGVRVWRWGLGGVRFGRCVGVGVRVRVGVRMGREYCVLRERCVWVRVAVRADGARGVGFGVAVRV